jgi:hypothetical protein
MLGAGEPLFTAGLAIENEWVGVRSKELSLDSTDSQVA